MMRVVASADHHLDRYPHRIIQPQKDIRLEDRPQFRGCPQRRIDSFVEIVKSLRGKWLRERHQVGAIVFSELILKHLTKPINHDERA